MFKLSWYSPSRSLDLVSILSPSLILWTIFYRINGPWPSIIPLNCAKRLNTFFLSLSFFFPSYFQYVVRRSQLALSSFSSASSKSSSGTLSITTFPQARLIFLPIHNFSPFPPASISSINIGFFIALLVFTNRPWRSLQLFSITGVKVVATHFVF